MKRILRWLHPLRVLTALALLLPVVGIVSIAHASTGASTSDPLGTMAVLYDYIRTGKGTAALGAALTLAVFGLRNYALGSWIPWFKTKWGGYALGFGTSIVTYLAAGLGSGNPLTLSLFINAIGAGWAAAGAWEHLADLLGMGGAKPSGSNSGAPPAPATPNGAGPAIVKRALLATLTVALAASAWSCGAAQKANAKACEEAVLKKDVTVGGVTMTLGDAVESALATGTAGIPAALLGIASSLGMPVALDSISCALDLIEAAPVPSDAGPQPLVVQTGETRAQRIAAARSWVAQQRAAK